MNWKAADMWSFAVLLWEMATRQVPFADLSPMEIGMKVGRPASRISATQTAARWGCDYAQGEFDQRGVFT